MWPQRSVSSPWALWQILLRASRENWDMKSTVPPQTCRAAHHPCCYLAVQTTLPPPPQSSETPKAGAAAEPLSWWNSCYCYHYYYLLLLFLSASQYQAMMVFWSDLLEHVLEPHGAQPKLLLWISCQGSGEPWLPPIVFFGWALWILSLARKPRFKSTGKPRAVCHSTAHDLGPWFRLNTGLFCSAALGHRSRLRAS